MKKAVIILIITALIMSLAACGTNENETTLPNSATPSQTTQQADPSAPADALELLNTVWNAYAETDRFSACGGDASEENMNMSGAGKFSIDDASALDSTLGFPAAEIGKIDGAASLMHMMNANTFTCGAYKVKDAADTAALAKAIETNIQQRQWMCGFPDKLVVASVGGYIVSFFGENETVNTFKSNLTAAYSSSEILCEAAIV